MSKYILDTFTSRRLSTLILSAMLAVLASGCASNIRATKDGIDAGRTSSFASLVPATELEQAATTQYKELLKAAQQKKALVSGSDRRVIHLRNIAKRITPYATRVNPRSKDWRWEVNLISSKQHNAFCMPGGKIAFFTALISDLKLTEDEVAVIMGHEIAHALREHARSRMGKNKLTQTGTAVGAQILGAFVGKQYAGLINKGASLGGSLLTLKFSRGDESEADLVGLDLAARAGFDPRAGVTLWQKMSSNKKGGTPQWLSTHPAGQNRIAAIEKYLPAVMPLYNAAKKAQAKKR